MIHPVCSRYVIRQCYYFDTSTEVELKQLIWTLFLNFIFYIFHTQYFNNTKSKHLEITQSNRITHNSRCKQIFSFLFFFVINHLSLWKHQCISTPYYIWANLLHSLHVLRLINGPLFYPRPNHRRNAHNNIRCVPIYKVVLIKLNVG